MGANPGSRSPESLKKISLDIESTTVESTTVESTTIESTTIETTTTTVVVEVVRVRALVIAGVEAMMISDVDFWSFVGDLTMRFCFSEGFLLYYV